MKLVAAAIYILITVTYGGKVWVSPGFSSLRACEEAKSIAETGVTIEENQKNRATLERIQSEEKRKFEAEHPPRSPTDEDRKNCRTGDLAKYMVIPFEHCTIENDGLTHFYKDCDECSVGYVRTADDLKYAKCALEPPPG
jgi:hypothetical protein